MLNKKLQKKLEVAAKRKVQREYASKVISESIKTRREFLEKFDSHVVIRHMTSGLPSSLIGETGTLYSFFGLTLEKAIQDVEFLRSVIDRTRITRASGIEQNEALRYKIGPITSKREIFKATPMGGTIGAAKSWVYSIETGQSGLQRFLWKPEKFADKSYSTSKEAIQVKQFGKKSVRVNSGGPNKYQNMAFFTRLYNQYLEELTAIIRRINKLK